MMNQQGPDLEQRLSKLEAQLDRFSLTLHQWQQTQKQLQPMESRLSELIEQSTDILNRWTATDQPHAEQHRIQQFEETVQHELNALRGMHEEPVKRLQEQASHLGDICAAASNSVAGLQRTESRFAALETDLHARLTELVSGLHAVAAELRAGA